MYRKILPPVFLILVLIAACGCTGTPPPPPPSTTQTAIATATQPASLVPGPTDTMPDYNKVTVDVGEKDYLGMILVTFQGGKGQIHTKRIEVKLTRFDRSVQTVNLGTNKGDEVELQGTRGSGQGTGQPDRVEVTVFMDDGRSYKIVDLVRDYRSRG